MTALIACPAISQLNDDDGLIMLSLVFHLHLHDLS